MQQNNEKIIYSISKNYDILFQIFWKKPLNLSNLKPHIFFIVSLFRMI